MKNRKTGKQNGPVAGMTDRDAPENSPVAAGEAKCPAGTGEEINMVQETRASDSPAVQKLIEELTVAGEDDAFAGQRKTPDPAVSGEGVSGGEGQPDPLKQAEEELVKNARSERSRERIRSIIAARRDAESRLEYYETAVRRFRQMLSDTGMDMGDIAATLHYRKLVASGDPHLMHCALDILNHERESLCRRLGIAEPGVDLFADVPEIREAVERRELKMELALRLANLERAERAARERSRAEAEKGRRAVELFSDIADFMKTVGASLQPYASEADHPLKMQKIFEYMLAPGWADDFVANVPRSMWAKHVKYLYDNLALPVSKPAMMPQPLRSSPVVAGQIADNPGMSSAERIMRRMDEMGL